MRATPEYEEMFQVKGRWFFKTYEAQYLQNKEATVIHLNEAGLGGYTKKMMHCFLDY